MAAERSAPRVGSRIEEPIEIDSPPPSPTLGIRAVQRAASTAARQVSPAASEVSMAGTVVSLSDFAPARRLPRGVARGGEHDEEDEEDRLTNRSFTDVPGTPVPWAPFNTTDPRVKRRYRRAEDLGRGSQHRSPAYQPPQLAMAPIPVEVERKMQDLKVLLDMWDLDAVAMTSDQPLWEVKVDLVLSAVFAPGLTDRLQHDLSERTILIRLSV